MQSFAMVALSLRSESIGFAGQLEKAMKRIKLIDRIRYAFDNSMSRGPIAVIDWLAVVSAMLILAIAFVVYMLGVALDGFGPEGHEHTGFIDVVWLSLMRTLDSGTMGGDAGRWPFLFAMLGVTLGGIFVISTLIGVTTSGIEGISRNCGRAARWF
jgi:hypothetical protein